MPDKKKKTPAQLIKANKKIAHTKKLPNTGYGMTSAPLDPVQKKKNREIATTAGVAVGAPVASAAKALSNFGSYDPFKGSKSSKIAKAIYLGKKGKK